VKDQGFVDVRRLVLWNRLWLGLLVLGILLAGAQHLSQRLLASTRQLRAAWSDGGLTFSSISDGPFVVTHLSVPGVQSEGDKAVAQLAVPVAIIDSRGARLDPEELRKLTWRNIYGQPVPPPQEGAPIRALYFRPLQTGPSPRLSY
jgi:hypothetical protein